MTEEKFTNEEEIRRFLLGELPDGEREEFEARFIAEDSGLFERIRVVEDELIEAYVRGALSAAESAKFEREFLTTRKRRERVALTRALLARLAAEKTADARITATAPRASIGERLAALFRAPRLAFGAAVALLILIGGLWLLIFRPAADRDELAHGPTPTPAATAPSVPTPVKTVDGNVNAPVNDGGAKTPEPAKTPAITNAPDANKTPPKEAATKPSVAVIALFAGTIRGGGATRTLNLSKETAAARFRLNLESSDYQTYRAELVDADGAVLYRSAKLTGAKTRIDVSFPTAKLRNGDYFVRLYGFNAAGEEESAADFQFRVDRR